MNEWNQNFRFIDQYIIFLFKEIPLARYSLSPANYFHIVFLIDSLH